MTNSNSQQCTNCNSFQPVCCSSSDYSLCEQCCGSHSRLAYCLNTGSTWNLSEKPQAMASSANLIQSIRSLTRSFDNTADELQDIALRLELKIRDIRTAALIAKLETLLQKK